MEGLKPYLVDKVKSIGIDVSNCKSVSDLCKFLPKGYLFIDQRLWCENIHVDADGYDYENAILRMIVKLNKIKGKATT